MRVPLIHCREIGSGEEPAEDRVLLTMFGTSLLVSALIWVLAIAKALDLYGSL
jgi:hypothetical protein